MERERLCAVDHNDLRGDGNVEHLHVARTHGLGGRAGAKPVERTVSLAAGDRLVMVSDGVTTAGDGKAGLAEEGVVRAALQSQRGTAADTVREIHRAVVAASGGELTDDATALCLSIE